MHKRSFIVILSLIFVFVTMDGLAARRSVTIKGRWSRSTLRSSMTTEPIVTIHNMVLEIYFPGALDNVLIRIANERGEVVFEECISVQAMENYSINLSQKGGYQMEIVHFDKGFLTGLFYVD